MELTNGLEITIERALTYFSNSTVTSDYTLYMVVY